MCLESGDSRFRLIAAIFYVYEHWRPDKDICFYVGKGHGKRAYSLSRKGYHLNIRNRLAALGMCVEVRLVRGELTETEAFDLERERIAFWRSAGVRLANLTDGGEGPAGLIFSADAKARLREKRKHRMFTEADRAAMSEGRLGMKFSADHRANLSARKRGVPRKPFTAETLKKMRAAGLKREAEKRAMYSDEVRRTSRIKTLA